ncbi:MAG: hypothetical protein AAF211_13790 [Myxococcota bacterium]
MRPRPRYESRSPLSRETLRERFRRVLDEGHDVCAGKVSERHVSLRIAESDRHLWSPWLSVELVDEPEGTKLQGYFGPHPYLWGLFTAVYATQVFVFLAGAIHGMVSWTLDMPLTGLWVSLAMIVTLGLSCALNIAGEWAGKPQMDLTRAFLARTLAGAGASSARTAIEA